MLEELKHNVQVCVFEASLKKLFAGLGIRKSVAACIRDRDPYSQTLTEHSVCFLILI
jgi:hypothetical protein